MQAVNDLSARYFSLVDLLRWSGYSRLKSLTSHLVGSIVLVIYVWSALAATTHAQNLVPNHDFESFTMCPMFLGTGGPMLCTPWNSIESPDYFNVCGNLNTGVPNNFLGFQPAQSGNAYTGVFCRLTLGAIDVREYIQVQLDEPLVAGACYEAGCYINLADTRCGIDRFGMLLSTDPIANPLGETPQINPMGTFFLDEVNWMLISGEFIAQGGEQYLTIGNFADDANTQFYPPCDDEGASAYYYIDNVYVQEKSVIPIEINLNGPLTGCESVIIDPGNPDYSYQWSNGSQDPVITVTESGTYSVTATFGCAVTEDEVDVVILSPPSVDLGPDMILCQGESISISLDPDIGTYTWQDGTIGPSYTITTGGLYQVTVENICGISIDEVLIQEVPDLPADPLGADDDLCEGEVLSFDFDPALGDFVWQDNTILPEYQIFSPGTYSVTITNACGMVEDEIEITYTSPPSLILPDTVLLCTGSFYLVELDPDDATYVWDDGSTNELYFISQPGAYSVTATNFCGQDVGVVEAISLNPPALELGPDTVICPGDSIILGDANIEGTPQWQDGTTAPVITVNTAGIYALTLSNTCGSVIDSVSVTVRDSFSFTGLGADLLLCPGESGVLYADINDTTAIVTWSDGSMNDSLVVSQSGLYAVAIATACQSFTDTIIVTIDVVSPVLSLPDTVRLCAGDTVRIDPQVSGVNFSWSTGAVSPFIDVSSPGLYALTVSNFCSTATDSVLILDAVPIPSVSLGVDTALCEGDSFELIPLFEYTDSWTWFDGSVNPVYTINAPGTYSISVENLCGTNADTIQISSLSPPGSVSLGADAAICSGDSVLFELNTTEGNILWSDGSGLPSFTVYDSGWVYVSVSNVCGSVTDSAFVSLLPSVPVLDLGQDQTICPGENVIIDPAVTGVSYLWQDGSTNAQYQATMPGTFVLTITNACGSDSDTLVITESNDPPVLDLGPDITACAGQPITLTAGIIGVSYSWNTGESTQSIEVNTNGVFTLSVGNACGSDTDSISVQFESLPPMQDLGPDLTICEGDQLVLTAIADEDQSVLWSDLSTGPQLVVTASGVYSVSVFNQCGTTTDTVMISLDTLPGKFSLGQDTTLCAGDTISLQVPFTGFDIQWLDGLQDQVYHIVESGLYVLTLSNDCGVRSDSIVVLFRDDSVRLWLPDQILLCPDESVLIDATLPIAASYSWNIGSTSPMIMAGSPGLYIVEATFLCGSTADTTIVELNPDCGADGISVFIPNVFSPNGDGVNDIFTYYPSLGANVRVAEATVFDRWGNQVYYTTSEPLIWDGMSKGKALNPGVYVYLIRLQIEQDGTLQEVQYSGDISLIR